MHSFLIAHTYWRRSRFGDTKLEKVRKILEKFRFGLMSCAYRKMHYKSGLAVQTTGATSVDHMQVFIAACDRRVFLKEAIDSILLEKNVVSAYSFGSLYQ